MRAGKAVLSLHHALPLQRVRACVRACLRAEEGGSQSSSPPDLHRDQGSSWLPSPPLLRSRRGESPDADSLLGTRLIICISQGV